MTARTRSDSPTMPAFRLLEAPWLVACVTFLIGAITVILRLQQSQNDPMVFVGIDGWFVFELAKAFPFVQNAILDNPAYRAQRILLSILAMPFGDAIPWALVVINLLALGLGTYAFAKLAQRHKVTVWLACLFGLWIGAYYAIHFDLTEVLAYALIGWTLVWWEQRSLGWAGLACGLAVLSKETTILYVVALAIGTEGWFRPRWWRFVVPAVLPFLLWQVAISVMLGRNGIAAGLGKGGAGHGLVWQFGRGLLFDAQSRNVLWQVQLLLVLVPALIALVWGVAVLRHDVRSALGWALVLNALFVISLPGSSTDYLVHSTRLSLAVQTALLWGLTRQGSGRARFTAIVCSVLPFLILFRPGRFW